MVLRYEYVVEVWEDKIFGKLIERKVFDNKELQELTFKKCTKKYPKNTVTAYTQRKTVHNFSLEDFPGEEEMYIERIAKIRKQKH